MKRSTPLLATIVLASCLHEKEVASHFPQVPTCELDALPARPTPITGEEAMDWVEQQGVSTHLLARMKHSGVHFDESQYEKLVQGGLGSAEARLLALALGLSVPQASDVSLPEGEYYTCPELLEAARHLSPQELAFMMWGTDQPFREQDFRCLEPMGDRYRLTAMAHHYTLCP